MSAQTSNERRTNEGLAAKVSNECYLIAGPGIIDERSHVTRAFPLVWVLKHPKSEKNEISPKAYPEEMEVIRASYTNTSSVPLFPMCIFLESPVT